MATLTLRALTLLERPKEVDAFQHPTPVVLHSPASQRSLRPSQRQETELGSRLLHPEGKDHAREEEKVKFSGDAQEPGLAFLGLSQGLPFCRNISPASLPSVCLGAQRNA